MTFVLKWGVKMEGFWENVSKISAFWTKLEDLAPIYKFTEHATFASLPVPHWKFFLLSFWLDLTENVARSCITRTLNSRRTFIRSHSYSYLWMVYSNKSTIFPLLCTNRSQILTYFYWKRNCDAGFKHQML